MALRASLVTGVAIVMGIVSGTVLFGGSVWNVVPWGVLAFCTAFLASTRSDAWKLGGTFGFVVSATFLWVNDTSPKTASVLPVLILLIVAAALFGLLCGLLMGWLGWTVRRVLARRSG